jgi:predicted nucleotidyltransferase
MRAKLNERYRKAAEEFAQRVRSALGDQVDSIILYGSVARGEAKRDSDIDILVICQNPEIARRGLSQVRRDFDFERNYAVLISLIDCTSEEFNKLRDIGSPFIQEVLHDGIILYDNGTFAEARERRVRAR